MDQIIAVVHANGTWLVGKVDSTVAVDDEPVLLLHDAWEVIQHTQLMQGPGGQVGVAQLPPMLVGVMGEPGPTPTLRVVPSVSYVPKDQTEWQERLDAADRERIQQRTGIVPPPGSGPSLVQ